MHNKIEISIIIPAHNNHKSIGKLFKSIKENHIKVPYETIIVLDRCTDNTAAICQNYENIQVLTSDKPGAGPSRHYGALSSRGRILLFLDADIVLGNSTVNDMYSMLIDNDLKIAVTGEYNKLPANPTYLTEFLALKWFYVNTHRLLEKKSKDTTEICDFGGAPAMISRDNYFKSGGFEDARYRMAGGEEWEAAVKISRICPIIFCRKFNVDHDFKSVFSVFFSLIKRTYNFAMLLNSLDLSERQKLTFAADITERIKLFLFFLIFLSVISGLFIQFLLYISAALFIFYIIIDINFIRFLYKEKGIVYLVPGFIQDWILFAAKATGVLAAYFNLLILKKNNHRY